jgi:hypothetical protein
MGQKLIRKSLCSDTYIDSVRGNFKTGENLAISNYLLRFYGYRKFHIIKHIKITIGD